MLPNCKQVAEQASENIDTPLTGLAWFKHKIHVLMCSHCERYIKQLNLSSQTVESLNQYAKPNEAVKAKVAEKYRELHCNRGLDSNGGSNSNNGTGNNQDLNNN